MELFKLSILGSVGAFTVAAFALAPAFPQEPAAAQEGPGSMPGSKPGPGALDGLLRPSTKGAQPVPQAGVPLQPANAPVGSQDDPFLLEERFRAQLVAPDLDAREEAFDRIAGNAAQSATAETALQAIADDLGDPDLAFVARLALRESRQRSARAIRSPSPFWAQGGLEPLEALEQRMQEMLDNDPFVRNFISGDPFAQDPFFRMGPGGPFRRRPSLFGTGEEDPFEALQQRMKDWREEVDGRRSSAGRSQDQSKGQLKGSPPAVRTQSSSMSMESTPDGIRVEITEDDGSGPATRVYEAPSMEALLEANPELKGRLR